MVAWLGEFRAYRASIRESLIVVRGLVIGIGEIRQIWGRAYNTALANQMRFMSGKPKDGVGTAQHVQHKFGLLGHGCALLLITYKKQSKSAGIGTRGVYSRGALKGKDGTHICRGIAS
jgi:hypothetical protein